MSVLQTGQNCNWKSRCRKLGPVSLVQSFMKYSASDKDPSAQIIPFNRSFKHVNFQAYFNRGAEYTC